MSPVLEIVGLLYAAGNIALLTRISFQLGGLTSTTNRHSEDIAALWARLNQKEAQA